MNTKKKHRRLVATGRLRLLVRQNIRSARRNWVVSSIQIATLKTLTQETQLSIDGGDLSLLDGKWYVTHAGLLRIAMRRGCVGIRAVLQQQQSDPITHRWVFRAIVFKSCASRGFVGYGDADPSNVSPLVRGAEMRVAETRAVNRALRKAYGVGLCSVEELGWSPRSFEHNQTRQVKAFSTGSNGHHRSEPRLRDQLCLLIRQHNLDATLVKAYAAEFCGTQTLKDASRDLVESFISHLSSSAKKDRAGLVCKLNSYSQRAEVKQ